LNLAALFDTLIADSDGVYNVRFYNDRLLLGLKGTMSEAELHLLRQRLDAGRMNQVYRGAYRQNLPTGLVRLEDGRVVKDPNEQVQHAIELVLTLFAQLGTTGKVLRALRQNQVLLARRQVAGLHKGELLWKRPTDDAIYQIVLNPAYAGAFAYGRKQLDPTKATPGRRATGRCSRPMDAWLQLQQGAYPAYISWEQYLANQIQLQANGQRWTLPWQTPSGAVREGTALLQGLAVCGVCGCRLYVRYKGQHHTYGCNALNESMGEPPCLSVSGPVVDETVVQAFFAALQPAQLDILDALLADQQADRQRQLQHWQDRLRRAEYEANLAARQYRAVDPDNRLVASELERRWEAGLRELQAAQEALDRFQETPTQPRLSAVQRAQFRQLGQTLPTVWPTLGNDHKKLLLRSLIAQVIVRRPVIDRLDLTIVWISGHYSVVQASLPINCQQDLPTYPRLVERLHALWQQGLTDVHIAQQLSHEGFRSARRSIVSLHLVRKIRHQQGWTAARARSWQALELDGYLTVRGLAARLGVQPRWVYTRLNSQVIDPAYVTRQPQTQVYLIQNDPVFIARLQGLLADKAA
jgi:hypothetical protein